MDTDQILRENTLMAEQLNQLSETLLGFREGKFTDMITKVNHLKLKAQNVEIDNKFRELADAINDLKDMADDIMSDA